MSTLDPARLSSKTQELHDYLCSHIIGQPEAVSEIVRVHQLIESCLVPVGRPIASFLFLGPTGVGKTRTVEALAEFMFHDPRALIKVDCAEFQHSHEISKLIGSPPGYLGHRETRPVFTNERLRSLHTKDYPISLVLFDEVEKSSDALWNLLLGILDKATLTLGDNSTVSFHQSIIFMTSNTGSREIAAQARGGVGFTPAGTSFSAAASSAARRKFTPEFLNRFDRIITFSPLTSTNLRAILDLELSVIQQRIASSPRPFFLTLTPTALDALLLEGTDPTYGARPLRRTLERRVLSPAAALIASNQIPFGGNVELDYKGDFIWTLKTRARTRAAA